MPKLGVNIDHVATLRQARRESVPDPVAAAAVCEAAGAHSIVAHLREDRRHIQDRDIQRLRRTVKTRFNLEMSLDPGIVEIARAIRPDQATLVPERRQEVTTEGGLDCIRNERRLRLAIARLGAKKIIVSLFIDPSAAQIKKARELGAPMIELHTGTYARATTAAGRRKELRKLDDMTQYARQLGLIVNAGHGLDYDNVRAVAKIPGMEELNIGHAIISRAVFVGLSRAVSEMVRLAR